MAAPKSCLILTLCKNGAAAPLISYSSFMKTYVVHLDDGRSIRVRAESYQESPDAKLLFYIDGKAIPDIYFEMAAVDGVSIDDSEDDPVMGVYSS